LIDAGTLSRVSMESVHFTAAGDFDDVRDALLRTTNVFESGAAITDRESLFAVLASALNLSEDFGANWDAAIDAFRCLEASGARRGFILVVHHGKRLWRDAADVAGELVESWLSVAEERRAYDEPFHLVFVW
jgi:hypothetical protein